jgi:hypothetical protein
MIIPSAVLSSASIREPQRDGAVDETSLVSLQALTSHLTCLIRHRLTPDQRIFDALVQPANSVAGDFFQPLSAQLSCHKMFRWQFLDCEADGVRGPGSIRRAAASSPYGRAITSLRSRSSTALLQCRNQKWPFVRFLDAPEWSAAVRFASPTSGRVTDRL